MSTQEKIEAYLQGISELDRNAEAQARRRLDSLVKPPGSLGGLEDIASQLSAITGNLYVPVAKRCIAIFCSDNGVVAEGVASAPQSVTLAQTINFTRGMTGVAVLARQFGADLKVVDVGVDAELNCPEIKNRKIRKSTNNIAIEPAMTREEALQALLTGIETAIEAAEEGYQLLGTGEMGIGNTTTSSAVLSVLTGIPAEDVVGKGAGLDSQGFLRKKQVITQAIERYRPDPEDPIDVIAKVGGFDLAAMAGFFIGAAYCRLPVVIDGFISIVSALCAARLNPLCKGYMIPSHCSAEPGYLQTANELGVSPSLMLKMRLGEGSGCPLMFAVIDGACAMMKNMATFEEAMIDSTYLEKIKGPENFTVDNASKTPQSSC